MDDRRWDAEAGTARWIRPDEVVVWRGGPDPSAVFAPQDAFLVPVSVIWTALAALILGTQAGSDVGPLAGAALVVVLALGLYLVVGRFVVKRWTRRRTWYALTTARAVEVTGSGRAVREAPLSVPMELRRRPDGRRATAVWPLARPALERPLFGALAGPGTMSPEWFRGTGWPGTRRWTRPEVAFCDVTDVDGLARAAGQVGVAFAVVTGPGWPPSARGRPPAEPPAPLRSDGGAQPSGGRRPVPAAPPPSGPAPWVRARLLRRPYRLWSPLEADEVVRRLGAALAPVPPTSVGLRRPAAPYQGSAAGGVVHLVCAADARNAWRYEFDGDVVVEGPGSWLAGRLGPPGLVPVLSALWVGAVALLLLVAAVGLVVDLATSHGWSVAPFVLIPAGMLAFFVVLVEVASRSAAADWRRMEDWLCRLLDVPDGPRP